MIRRPITVVIAAALIAGGCGDEDGLSDRDQEYADAWAVTISDAEQLGATDEEAACMGDAIMAELGASRFEANGVEPEDITPDDPAADSPGQLLGANVVREEEAATIIAAWEECADLPALLGASAFSESAADPEVEACFVEQLRSSDLTTQLLLVSFVGDEDAPALEVEEALLGALDTCGVEG